MSSEKYWAKRKRARMDEYHKDSDKVIGKVLEAHQGSIEDLDNQINEIFNTFARTHKISLEEAKMYLNTTESKRFIENLKKTIKNVQDEDLKAEMLMQINTPAYRARITRIEAVKQAVNFECKKLASIQVKELGKGLVSTANTAYYKTIFDMQQRTGLGFSFAEIPAKQVEEILKHNWSGKHFSKRIWGNNDRLASELEYTLTKGFMSGASIEKMSKEIADKMQVGEFAATRLIRTETTYVANSAELEAYKEAGVEKIIFLATLDLRTSDICRQYDGEIIDLDKAVIGKNIPPLHAHCRSTTVEIFDDDNLAELERRSRDSITGKNKTVPANTKYKDWHKENVDINIKNDKIIGEEDINLNSFVDKVKKLNASEYTDRVALGKDILSALDLDGINVTVKNINDNGYCAFNYLENDKMGITDYVLKHNDPRGNNYKIKTAFHEAYHAKAKDMKFDYKDIKDKWLDIEEPFAESAAHYMMKQVGITEEIAPAYASRLVNILPRLKQLGKFKDCVSISDFGKVAWKDRLNGIAPVWKELHDECMNIKHEWKEYSKQYLAYIQDNKSELIDVMLNNMPEYSQYKDAMVLDCKSSMEKINNDKELSSNENLVFTNVLVITMNRLGVK